MSKKFFLSLLVIFAFSVQGKAQVGVNTSTVNSSSLLDVHASATLQGGVQLPQLTTVQRDALKTHSDWSNSACTGLVINNLDTGCNEYWNGSAWISLCGSTKLSKIILANYSDATNADITSYPPANNDLIFNYDGSDATTGVAAGTMYKDLVPFEPDCTNFTCVVIGGNATIVTMNSATGRFHLSVPMNQTAMQKTIVIHITSNCTGDSRDYVFQELPNTTLCPVSGTKPIIASPSSGLLCQNGTVQMYITPASTDAGALYIWSLNGVQVGTGVSYKATAPGSYVVYEGAIGCNSTPAASDPFVVSPSNQIAADAVTITASNTAICSGTPVVFTACDLNTSTTYAGAGVVHWFADGLEVGTGVTYSTSTPGTYTALLVDGNACTSLVSNDITIETKAAAAIAFAPTDVTINGTSGGSAFKYCADGELHLVVTTPNPLYTYTWYFNGQAVGQGTDWVYTLPIPAPASASMSVTADVPGDATVCAATAVLQASGSTDTPAKPVITATNGAMICNTVGSLCELQATVDPSAAPVLDYSWSLNGAAPTSTGTNPIYEAPSAGTYTVYVTTADCLYASAPFKVTMEATPVLTWNLASSSLALNGQYLYTVTNNGAPATGGGYTWSTTNMASATPDVISNNATTVVTPTGNSAYITFNTGSATGVYDQTVTVTAKGDCGLSAPLTLPVYVKAPFNTVPSIEIIGTPTCGGVLYHISNIATMLLDDPGMTYRWQASQSSGFNPLIPGLASTGTHNEYFYVPFTVANDNIYVQAQALLSSGSTGKYAPLGGATPTLTTGSPAVATPATITGYGINNSTTTPAPTCFNATTADFSKSYQYSIPAAAMQASSTVKWTFRNGGINPPTTNAATTVTDGSTIDLATGNVVSLAFDPSLATDQNLSTGGTYTVTLTATYTDVNGCTQSVSTPISIMDKDCCTTLGVTDAVGNTYTTATFGGLCWMTQNLRTPETGALSYNGNSTNDAVYGLFYSPAAASGAYCPAGWRIPANIDFVNAGRYDMSTHPASYSYNGAVPPGSTADIRGAQVAISHTAPSQGYSKSHTVGGYDLPGCGVYINSTKKWANDSQQTYIWMASPAGAEMVYWFTTLSGYSNATGTNYHAVLRCVKQY